MKILKFNLEEALNGGSIALTKVNGGTDPASIFLYILYFKLIDNGSVELEYVGIGQKDNKEYFFRYNGELLRPLLSYPLYLSKIEGDEFITIGTEASRGPGEGLPDRLDILITSLLPREQLAQSAMVAIIHKMNKDILNIDNYGVEKICELSFKFAQFMLNKAADIRDKLIKNPDKPKPDEPGKDIEVDINNVNNTTDKLLYNIANSLNFMGRNSKSNKDVLIAMKNNFITMKDNFVAMKNTLVAVKDYIINTYDKYAKNFDTQFSSNYKSIMDTLNSYFKNMDISLLGIKTSVASIDEVGKTNKDTFINMNTNLSTIANNMEHIGEMNKKMDIVLENFKTLNTTTTTISSDVSNIKTTTSNISTTVGTINTNVNSIKDTSNSIKLNTDALVSSNSNISSNSSSIKTSVSNIETKGINTKSWILNYPSSMDVKVINSPSVSVENTPNVKVTNMLSEPVHIYGDVGVTGTVSVDNFPSPNPPANK